MKKIPLLTLAALLLPTLALAAPRLVVTGVTEYNPDLAWNGFTILAGQGTAKLVDMNGNLAHEWDLYGSDAQPAKVLPGGHLLATIYPSYPEAGQGHNTLALLDFDSSPIRSFNRLDKASRPTPEMPLDENGEAWISRQHHDFQLEGNPVGYYAPGLEPDPEGRMLILCNATLNVPAINSNHQLLDDRIIIVDKDGNITFDWLASDHFAEFKNLADNARALEILQRGGNNPAATALSARMEYNGFDWFHINCVSWLGPNKWYDAGDERFHPENIIADSRTTSHMFIIDHRSGEIVWQIAPPFIDEDAGIGPVYGVHATHMIPKGLPGEGNILIFDNGGTHIYYNLPSRQYSRILEIDPLSKQIVWQYTPLEVAGQPVLANLFSDSLFYSSFISNAQRLPNGNTLICEGNKNRIFEVTSDHQIVWEYINPYSYGDTMVSTYRAYRVPYEWLPQLPKGREIPVKLALSSRIQVPNDNGELPDILPRMDQVRNRRIGGQTPVLLPSLQEGFGFQAAPLDDYDEEPEIYEPTMRIY